MKNNDFVQKPTLGLTPRADQERINDARRWNDICSAISRYQEENLKIPELWVEELNELEIKYKKNISLNC